MGFVVSKIYNAFKSLKSNKEVRLLILGLDNAGKTTILCMLLFIIHYIDKMQLGEVQNVVPTVGFNVEYVQYENINFQVWDIGGQYEIRPYWRCYYPKTNAVVFTVDSSDKDRIDIVKQELFILLEEEDLKEVPLAIVANKQDKVGCLTDKEVSSI